MVELELKKYDWRGFIYDRPFCVSGVLDRPCSSYISSWNKNFVEQEEWPYRDSFLYLFRGLIKEV